MPFFCKIILHKGQKELKSRADKSKTRDSDVWYIIKEPNNKIKPIFKLGLNKMQPFSKGYGTHLFEFEST